MSKKLPNPKKVGRPDQPSRQRRAAAAKSRSLPSNTVLFVFITMLCLAPVAVDLRAAWSPLFWLPCLGLWAWYWRQQDLTAETARIGLNRPRLGSWLVALSVLFVAAGFRLYRIHDLPVGPYIDEILTLLHALELREKPFDLFGHTPLTLAGWVETANLYLYFNLLIVKLFGVSYGSMKLLSAIPGIATCGLFYYAARSLFDTRTAIWITALFTVGHWPVRLSRYGWDASFMIMAFAAAIALLWQAKQSGQHILAYLAGLAAGLSLFSYTAARIAVLSLVLFLLCELAFSKEQRWRNVSLGFFSGLVLCAFPLLCYYLANPSAFWVRANELSVFNHPTPFATLAENIWRHGLMFHLGGGTYARDNFPGTAMLDPLTGIALLIGLFVAAGRLGSPAMRLLAWLWLMNFIPGIFSVSQEGAPYVYRTAALMIPTFLLAGVGISWLTQQATALTKVPLSAVVPYFPALIVLLAAALNIRLYFELEPVNYAAMRTMAYEARMIGDEIASDNQPTIVTASALAKLAVAAKANEPFAGANPAMKLPLSLSVFAVTAFSGRYNSDAAIETNLNQTAGLYFMENLAGDFRQLFPHGHGKVIFAAQDRPTRELLLRDAPVIFIKQRNDLRGEPMIAVAIMAN